MTKLLVPPHALVLIATHTEFVMPLSKKNALMSVHRVNGAAN
jgi:hypothetical protein